jgi:hypothetical protein
MNIFKEEGRNVWMEEFMDCCLVSIVVVVDAG